MLSIRPPQRSAIDTWWRTQPVVAVALASIAGGLVFRALIAAMMPPMMGMIGSLLGVPSLGWGVHLLFSAIIGAVFGAVVGHRAASWAPAIALGAAYGVVWWILGPLLAAQDDLDQQPGEAAPTGRDGTWGVSCKSARTRDGSGATVVAIMGGTRNGSYAELGGGGPHVRRATSSAGR